MAALKRCAIQKQSTPAEANQRPGPFFQKSLWKIAKQGCYRLRFCARPGCANWAFCGILLIVENKSKYLQFQQLEVFSGKADRGFSASGRFFKFVNARKNKT